MLDFTKKENDNIKFLFDYIQVNGSENLSKLFRINFLKKGIGLWKNGLVEKIVNFFFPIILPPYFFRQNYRILKKEKASKTLIFWAF